MALQSLHLPPCVKCDDVTMLLVESMCDIQYIKTLLCLDECRNVVSKRVVL